MHFVTFIESGIESGTETGHESGRRRLGALDRVRNEVVDLECAAPELPRNVPGLIARGSIGIAQARAALESGAARFPLDAVRLCAPFPPVRNIFCVGKNYRDHLHEVRSLAGTGEAAAPEAPIFFTKATSTVMGPGDPIPARDDPTQSADYEGELAVVIGPGGRAIPRAEAWRHVYGYTIVNDVTSRRLQKLHQQWFLGKSLDGFCPLGPALVTRDVVPDVRALRVHTRVNDELRQEGLVGQMIFDIPALIETLSQVVTLVPGDIIATGTPAGVGAGYSPPRYLQPGDRVAVTIEPIGTLENPVI
jgi:2-keto-4-pentenoate hydratase/2-oxohepta-3-ene-1,7-dioic acid hydratase in catechol pathway